MWCWLSRQPHWPARFIMPCRAPSAAALSCKPATTRAPHTTCRPPAHLQGNISRFINHSCEPNCETQKWLIRGELAIGLFTLKDIKAGQELTFDYNFERYGDKPMRCYCATPG